MWVKLVPYNTSEPVLLNLDHVTKISPYGDYFFLHMTDQDGVIVKGEDYARIKNLISTDEDVS